REALLQRNAPLGIRLRSDQPPKLVLDDLDRFAVVALEFPKFGDGRAYSYARLLRERYGYRGELRAVGNVLRDQALFMLRCGFDAFELAEDSALEGWRESLAEISVFYQPTADGRSPAHALRAKCAGNGATADQSSPTDAKERSERASSNRDLGAASARGLTAAPASVDPTAGYWAY
ncbi:MAG: DUF934 domain-containing protein, partial [Proteobacteria bacterium]|nr:DUF934 domain-containing protein [Pseudomonadota bacterium]